MKLKRAGRMRMWLMKERAEKNARSAQAKRNMWEGWVKPESSERQAMRFGTVRTQAIIERDTWNDVAQILGESLDIEEAVNSLDRRKAQETRPLAREIYDDVIRILVRPLPKDDEGD